MGKRLRIVAAHGSPDQLVQLADALGGSHEVIMRCGTVVALQGAMLEHAPDLVVTGITFPDGDGLDTIIEVGREQPVPAVIVTPRRSMDLVEKAIRDHVMAYLLEPISRPDLHAAVMVAYARFEQFRELSEQVGDLRAALEARKVIERAKGMLMASEGLSEDAAYRKLRSAAQDERVRLVDAARSVLDEAEM